MSLIEPLSNQPPKIEQDSPACRLGETLQSQGLISADQLRVALHEQASSSELLGRLLVRLGFLPEIELRKALALKLGIPEAFLASTTPHPEAVCLVPKALARRHGVVPLLYQNETATLQIAVANPNDVVALDALRRVLPPECHIESLLATDSEISAALDVAYSIDSSLQGILAELEGDGHFPQSTAPREPAIVRLLEALLTDAAHQNASDIHFEPEAGFLKVRCRVDGILQPSCVLRKSLWPPLSVRIKILSDLNIAESRAPQDGHFSMSVHGRPLDFRVSSHPTIHGESVVLRILDRNKGIQTLESLGLARSQLNILKRSLTRPEGIFLLTGPTGSGKTTTLYSVLQHLNADSLNIMTLEDPVEYPMPRIRQTSISEMAKIDFADGVRSMLRQDPDVILIGEIRDAPTAEMAARAAMTGHQVFTTLHCNSALGAISRLTDMGVAAHVLAGNIIAIMAQRLVRRLCRHCQLQRPPSPREAELFADCLEEGLVFDAYGCQECSFTGFKGRLAVTELLKLDTELDELIARSASRRELYEMARSKGFRTLADDGVCKVREGLTTINELVRVIDLSDRLPALEH